jgi:5-formyltetrahydrofolate cyclo-ligase
MTKKEARVLYRQKRMALTDKELMRMDDLILIHFQELSLPPIQTVHTYLAVDSQNEIETSPLLRFLQFRYPGLRTVVPRVEGQTLVHFYIEDDTLLEVNQWGIPEPVHAEQADPLSVDLVLVPLLCFDEKGNRVGYGMGYYDRFLASCRPDVLKIGLSYFEPEDCVDDHAEFDIPLNYCVTPNRLYEFD